jgi:sugar (pentulose or hexulose) kinase
LGAALLAGSGIGINNFNEKAGTNFLNKTKIIYPEKSQTGNYQTAFHIYKKYSEVLQ